MHFIHASCYKTLAAMEYTGSIQGILQIYLFRLGILGTLDTYKVY